MDYLEIAALVGQWLDVGAAINGDTNQPARDVV